ncbi:uncharacterized protein LOC107640316 [Arachis ipaensis]|uniref:uncharacterized protein LOC107640316 n=1 Tax=Arachis ipaensis TaxID=130454 RepID=UPI0007AF1C13|nr:uncharacterized protein LOC107640316 [Arachis ipaensis]
MTNDELKNLFLIEIEKILNSNAKSLRDYQSMPYPEMSDSRGKIVLNVASSEIASLLLPGGRMAHSRFSITITITDESTCNIKHGSLKAELLIQSSLIIWDEAPVLKLHTNMRLLMSSLDQDEGEMKRFANWILDVGNGNIGSVVSDESEIEISDDLLITTTDDPLSHLVDFAYPNLLQNMSDYSL